MRTHPWIGSVGGYVRDVRRVGAGILVAGLFVLGVAGCSDGSSPGAASKATSASTTAVKASMRLTSPEFTDGGTIPTVFTCAGAGSSPALDWSAPPAGTKELALLVFDPDAGNEGFVHYLVWGVAPTARGTQRDRYPGGLPGMNSRGNEGWVPPCPPAGEAHHYQFTVFALDRHPEIAPTANVHQFLEGIRRSVIGEGRLTGRYGR
jgi:Raf kinase inhibitor-like YbhB/YbcL family protein